MTPDVFMTQVRDLLATAETAGATLPDEVTAAAEVHTAVAALSPPTSERFEVHDAAADVVAAVHAGATPNLAELAARLRAADLARRDHEVNSRVLQGARDGAAGAALSAVTAAADVIVAEHLSPLHEQVLEAARAASRALAGTPLETHALITAPDAVRRAWAQLGELVVRRQALFKCRRLVYSLAQRQPVHDTRNLYAEFEDPYHFWPNLAPTAAPPPKLPGPDDDALARLAWTVTDAAKARPWLPSVSQQDAAWWARNGKAVEKLKSAQRSWGRMATR